MRCLVLPIVVGTGCLWGAAALQAAAKTQAAPAGDKALWQPYRITPRSGTQHIRLDGPWQLGWRDAAVGDLAELKTVDNWFSADVPGSVQWALHRAGKLPHPYEHLNSKQYGWVDEKVWYYRKCLSQNPGRRPSESAASDSSGIGGKSVELPARQGSPLVLLVFDGIDYYARVWFNGKLLGRHEGMFGGPAVEVGQLVRPGDNEIVVEVRAANYGNKSGWKPRGPEGTAIKPWVIAGGTGGEMFFPLGLWQGARIEIVPQNHLERPFLVTQEADPHQARLSLGIEVFAGGQSLDLNLHPWKNAQLADGSRGWHVGEPRPERFALRVELLDKAGGPAAFDETFPVEVVAGRNFVRREFRVAGPRLWWPNGMGQPHLYRARATLQIDGAAQDCLEFDYGIRTIRTVPTPGPRTGDRWANWQFVVNGRPLLVKGINWMPADILLDLPRERYRWLLGAAQAAGIQMLRVWGGGLLETEAFYETCNELGLLVWQDFPIGNRDTPEWPQDVWEAQVLQTVFRLRNHPSLALYCGGNEFNPYSLGNAATIGIWERALADFDPTRPMRRTSPDGGSLHTYPDMDPTWYGKLYGRIPWIAETGMHNIPEPQGIRELVDAAELQRPLAGMFEKEFPRQHPELIHHFVEYSPGRVPRMLSRASHIDDMHAPTLDALAEGTQIGAGEFYQVVADQTLANYPVTAGLLPWVYKRPWPVIAIMLVDGFGQPTAPYYFLKRTYEPIHVLVKLPRLLWAAGETVPLPVRVANASPAPPEGLDATVEVLDAAFASRWKKTGAVRLAPGPSTAAIDLGEFAIPADFRDTFFFVVAELREQDRRLVSRSVYWPRCLSALDDPSLRAKHVQSPQPMVTLDRGPWLKRQAAARPTALELALVERKDSTPERSRLRVRLRNGGKNPACNTQVDIAGPPRCFYATDNFFWLAPGETRELDLEVLWRAASSRQGAVLSARAWNAPPQQIGLGGR